MLTLAERVERLRFSQKEIADLAGVNKNTVGVVLAGGPYNIRSERAILAVVEAEERALLAHLLALHPEGGASPPAPHPGPLPVAAPNGADGARALARVAAE